MKKHTVTSNSKPAAGQIWLVNHEVKYSDGRAIPLEPEPSRPNLVLLMSFDEDFETNPESVARVFPVSTMYPFAGPYDLTISRDKSPLSDVPLMIECWNRRPVLKMNLAKPVAEVDEATLQDVEELQSRHIRGLPPHEMKSEASVGSPLEPDDWRLRFQNQEVEMTNFLSDPVNALE